MLRSRSRRAGALWSLLALAAVAAVAAAVGAGGAQDRPATATVWAVGDGADGSPASVALGKRIAAGRPDRVLYLGDVYDHGTADDFRERYDPAYGALAGITAPTPGNHEWAQRGKGYEPYWRRAWGRPVAPWYVLRVGGWRVLSLNSEADHGPRSKQVRWLRRELRAGTGTCTLAFWHRARYSASGSHGDQDDVAPLWEALRGHAVLVLSGHDHTYQRLHPIDGITEIVSATGGSRFDSLFTQSRVAASDNEHTGAVRMELRRGRADLAAVALDGTVLDRSSVACEP